MSSDIRPPSRFNLLREMIAPIDMVGMPMKLLQAAGPDKKPKSTLPVIILPGLGANDFSTAPLRYFLNRNGFSSEGWGLGFNTGGRGLIDSLDQLSDGWDVDRTRPHFGEGEVPALCDKMVERVLDRVDKLGSPVALVGWSLGGYVAREVARDLPDEVAKVVTMGSPAFGGPKYTAVAGRYKARNMDIDWIAQETLKRFDRPIQQPITAIYSKSDGIVGWRASIDNHSKNIRHVEVNISHMGLGYNAEVWDIVLSALINVCDDTGI